ncbi:MAG: DUF1822 family protein [Cyanobacteria bacterium P01_D01_bin.156]
MSVFLDNPVQPILVMPTDLPEWQAYDSISDPAARWRIYLHRIGLKAIMAWLQEEFEQPVLPWPHAALFDVWHTTDGLCLQLGERKLTVILSETIAMADIEVPQEWVDLPNWRTDYYLAAHINVDEQQLILWGYTNHHTLKTQGSYIPSNRTYRLNADSLVQDFSAFWVAQQLPAATLMPVDPLPELSPTQAESLIHQLVSAPEPRLALPFSQWGSLFSNDNWRQKFYQQRHGLTPVSVQDWLNQIYRQEWQPAHVLLAEMNSVRFRSVATTPAVLTCGKKIVLDNSDNELLLMFSVDMEADNRRNIRIQLYPSSEQTLPAQVILSLEISQTGKLLKSITAGLNDSFIQIPPFRCQAGQQLRVNIQLDNTVHREEFLS